MKYALTCLAGLTAMGLVTLAPDTASAGRYYYGGGWGGPGFGIYVGPRHRYGGYAFFIVPITTVATPMRTARGGGTVTVIGTSEHQF